MAFCENCGTEMEEGASFCTDCGATVEPGASEVPNDAGDAVESEAAEPGPDEAQDKDDSQEQSGDTPPTNNRKKLWISLGAGGFVLAAGVVLLLVLLLSGTGISGYTAEAKEDGTKVFKSANDSAEVVSELATGQEVLVTSEKDSSGTRYARIEYTPGPFDASTLTLATAPMTIAGYVRADDLKKVRDVKLAEVPDLKGLTKDKAETKVKDQGLKLNATYLRNFQTGEEVVTYQFPAAGRHLIIKDAVRVALDDPELAAAYSEAESRIGEANQKLAELQAMGADTADLAAMIQNAQAKHDGAKSIADLVGETDSAAYFANLVIQGSETKKQEHLVALEQAREAKLPKTFKFLRDEDYKGGTGPAWDVSASPSTISPGASTTLSAQFARCIPSLNSELWFVVEAPNGKKYGKKVAITGGTEASVSFDGEYSVNFPSGMEGGTTAVSGEYKIYFFDAVVYEGRLQHSGSGSVGCGVFYVR